MPIEIVGGMISPFAGADYGNELIPRLREATKDFEPHKELALP